jgi:hypothetical protein
MKTTVNHLKMELLYAARSTSRALFIAECLQKLWEVIRCTQNGADDCEKYFLEWWLGGPR